MPARAPELETYRIVDTGNGDRSLYFAEGHCYLFARYNKSSSITGRSRPIARFLCKELSALMLLDLFFVRPMVTLVANVLGLNVSKVYNTELFVRQGRKLTESHIRDIFAERFLAASNVRLGVGDYRHVAKHFALVAKIKYYDDGDSALSSYHDQAGHNAATADAHYARLASEHVDLRLEHFLGHRQASLGWHDWLRPPPNVVPARAMGAQLTPEPAPHLPAIEYSDAQPPHVPAMESLGEQVFVTEPQSLGSLAILQELLGSDILFNSAEQANLVDYVLWSNHDILGILPTGSGKSLAFFAHAQYAQSYSNDRVAVVFVPTVALKEDLLQRALDLKLYATADIDQHQKASIIFLTIDQVKQERTRNVLHLLCATGRLGKLFLDEAHCFHTDFNYRPLMRFLVSMRLYGRVVALTASCSAACLEDLQRNLFGAHRRPMIIRLSTNRQNLQYRVTKLQSQAQALMSIRVARMRISGPERIIVYLHSHSETNFFADMLGAARYHSGMADDEKIEQKARWENGEFSILCATSAFGMGIDYAHVRMVFIVGPTYDFESFFQMAGRAGRDGERSYSILLTYPAVETAVWESLSSHLRETKHRLVLQFIEHRCCRRRFQSRHFDVTETSCALSNSVLCDNCEYYEVQREDVSGMSIEPGPKTNVDAAIDEPRHDIGYNVQQQGSEVLLQVPVDQPQASIARNVRETSIPKNLQDSAIEDDRTLQRWTADLIIFAQKFRKNDSGQFCFTCLHADNKLETHEEAFRCPHLRGRCFRCGAAKLKGDGHRCGKDIPRLGVNQGCCFSCQFPPEIHNSENDGLNTGECRYGDILKNYQVYLAKTKCGDLDKLDQVDPTSAMLNLHHDFVVSCRRREKLLERI
jgi:superfamily II DNA/RNA helicase